jgi:hypothetical protein
MIVDVEWAVRSEIPPPYVITVDFMRLASGIAHVGMQAIACVLFHPQRVHPLGYRIFALYIYR